MINRPLHHGRLIPTAHSGTNLPQLSAFTLSSSTSFFGCVKMRKHEILLFRFSCARGCRPEPFPLCIQASHIAKRTKSNLAHNGSQHLCRYPPLFLNVGLNYHSLQDKNYRQTPYYSLDPSTTLGGFHTDVIRIEIQVYGLTRKRRVINPRNSTNDRGQVLFS